jgi:hypothetical protein
MANTYNTLQVGAVNCYGLRAAGELSFNDECAACAPCLDCTTSGITHLKPGWSFYGLNSARKCKGNAKVAETHCPGGSLRNLSDATVAWTRDADGNYDDAILNDQCSGGSAGPICSNCDAEHHHLKTGKQCERCDEGKVDIPVLIGLLFFVVTGGGVIISGVHQMLLE